MSFSGERESENLAATFYCDSDHPVIGAAAAEIGGRTDSPWQAAEQSFLLVRDGIRFGLDFIKVKASETLNKGYGACYNKSLVLVALLRRQGIEAQLCSVPVGRWFMRPYMGALKCLFINNPYHHCLVRLRLEGSWRLAEPTLDRQSYEALFAPLGVKWGISWGRQNQDRLYLEHLRGEPEVRHDIDAAIGRNLGNAMLPAPLTRAFCNGANRKAWKRAGLGARVKSQV